MNTRKSIPNLVIESCDSSQPEGVMSQAHGNYQVIYMTPVISPRTSLESTGSSSDECNNKQNSNHLAVSTNNSNNSSFSSSSSSVSSTSSSSSLSNNNNLFEQYTNDINFLYDFVFIDEHYKELFSEYLKRHLCLEGFLFLQQTKKLRQLSISSSHDILEKNNIIKEIITTFIQVGSEHELNIDEKLRKSVMDQVDFNTANNENDNNEKSALEITRDTIQEELNIIINNNNVDENIFTNIECHVHLSLKRVFITFLEENNEKEKMSKKLQQQKINLQQVRKIPKLDLTHLNCNNYNSLPEVVLKNLTNDFLQSIKPLPITTSQPIFTMSQIKLWYKIFFEEDKSPFLTPRVSPRGNPTNNKESSYRDYGGNNPYFWNEMYDSCQKQRFSNDNSLKIHKFKADLVESINNNNNNNSISPSTTTNHLNVNNGASPSRKQQLSPTTTTTTTNTEKKKKEENENIFSSSATMFKHEMTFAEQNLHKIIRYFISSEILEKLDPTLKKLNLIDFKRRNSIKDSEHSIEELVSTIYEQTNTFIFPIIKKKDIYGVTLFYDKSKEQYVYVKRLLLSEKEAISSTKTATATATATATTTPSGTSCNSGNNKENNKEKTGRMRLIFSMYIFKQDLKVIVKNITFFDCKTFLPINLLDWMETKRIKTIFERMIKTLPLNLNTSNSMSEVTRNIYKTLYGNGQIEM
ncbi:hypothetical protein ABK040_006909 [Willaertia magna]